MAPSGGDFRSPAGARVWYAGAMRTPRSLPWLCCLACLPALAAAPDAGPPRSPLAVAGKAPGSLDLSTLPQVEVTRPDIQYARDGHYRGVPLWTVIATLKEPRDADLVLLRFQNGMVIPLPRRDEKLWRELDPFIALELERDGTWSRAFPEIRKTGAENRDVRPLIFAGKNKLVVGTLTHPDVPEAARLDGFTPFALADSLAEVELATAATYWAPFQPAGASAEVKKGFGVFKARCQFCHGVKGAGSRYGPELKAGLKDDAHALFLHVRYREREAPEKGLMMPFFKDVSGEDAKALFAWMKAVSK